MQGLHCVLETIPSPLQSQNNISNNRALFDIKSSIISVTCTCCIVLTCMMNKKGTGGSRRCVKGLPLSLVHIHTVGDNAKLLVHSVSYLQHFFFMLRSTCMNNYDFAEWLKYNYETVENRRVKQVQNTSFTHASSIEVISVQHHQSSSKVHVFHYSRIPRAASCHQPGNQLYR